VVESVEFDVRTRHIKSLQLVTEQATYGDASRKLPFGAAVNSVAGTK
jgi:hypothetical protein